MSEEKLDRDRLWTCEERVGLIIIHFGSRCREAHLAGNLGEATRCALIGSALEDAVGEYLDKRERTKT